MKAIKDILKAEGTSVQEMDVNENYSYKSEIYENLVIEKVRENVISVEQYYTHRMDRMRDPEVRFDVSDPDNWKPIEYRVDPQTYDRDEDGINLSGFLSTWDKNLSNQFPAEEVTQA
jgi:hypothetical protein